MERIAVVAILAVVYFVTAMLASLVMVDVVSSPSINNWKVRIFADIVAFYCIPFFIFWTIVSIIMDRIAYVVQKITGWRPGSV